MKKFKIRTLLILFLLITLIGTISSASYSNVTMSVVEQPVCTIKFGTSSSFEKKLYSKDLTNKEVTLQLKVSNNEESLKPTGEIMLVIDNSKSMLETVSDGKTREDLVIDSAKTLITNLLEDNTKLKIGAVSFSTKSITEEGIAEDAKLISDLTNDADSLISAVSTIQYDGPRTDLDSGITLAKKYFTDKTDSSHKYIIVLSDGVPNVAIGNNDYYSDDVITQTKASLKSLSEVVDSNNVIVMLTGITDGDAIAAPSTKTYNEIIEEIFGTAANPTIGKFYYITDDKIEATIKTKIYEALQPVEQTFKNLKIVDYFPKEIVENFEFAYVEKATIGDISAKVDTSNNSITWTIPELKSGETAIVKYKLKLNKDYDESIVDKVLKTNAKVDLTYTDNSGVTDTKSSDVTPKLKLVEPKPTVLPKAGKTVFFGIIGLVLVIAAIFGIRYTIINNKMK